MPRYRTLNNDTAINVDGVRLIADGSGAFDVVSGSREEQVLIAGGAIPADARLAGAMTSGTWMTIPSVFRLRLTGTGTVSIDSKDSLGNLTLAVVSYTISAATDQIEFPYAGDNAVAIRATLTGTATAEVI